MADNVLVDNGELEDFTVSCDEGATGYVQRMKLTYSADGSEAHVEADADGLAVKLGQPIPPGTNAIGKLSANDGVDIGDVDVASVAGDVTVVQPTSSNLKGEMKITDGTDIAPVDPTNGLAVDVKAAAALPTGDNTVGRVKLTDGAKVGTLRTCTDKDVINVAITKADGSQVDTFGGTGGTSSTDGETFSPGSELGTGAMGVYESSPSAVADGKMGHFGMTADREVKVSLEAVSTDLDTGHGNDDVGSPVKVGARTAVSALPTALAADKRANAIADRFGRLMTTHIDPGMQVWKSANYTTQQTGAVIWDPASGKKIVVTHLQVCSYGTTPGRIILFFDDDTTYTEQTDQPLFKGSHSPSANSTPGALPPIAFPIFCDTADYDLRITTDADISLDVVVYGYEI